MIVNQSHGDGVENLGVCMHLCMYESLLFVVHGCMLITRCTYVSQACQCCCYVELLPLPGKCLAPRWPLMDAQVINLVTYQTSRSLFTYILNSIRFPHTIETPTAIH